MPYRRMVAALVEPSTRHLLAGRLRAALPGSTDALLEGLRNGAPSVRRWSAIVLDHAPHNDRIEEALRKATADRNRKVRKAAIHALACATCKPDGCLTSDGVGHLVDALLRDRSATVRRTCAGNLMFGQHGRDERVTAAFRQLLDHDADPVLRQRAAMFFAFVDVPRGELSHREWIASLRAHYEELVAA